MLPVLYSFRRCPYAMRARMALVVSGMRCELREVKLSAKPEAMLAASPKGTVPVMVMPDGTVIEQSIDIMRLALTVADPEGWLERDDPAIIAANDGPFKAHLDRYKYPDRHGVDPLLHRAHGMEFLGELEARLSQATHLGGSARGMVDAAVMPFVRQFAAVDRAWFDAQLLPGVQAWLASHMGSRLFDTAMVRVPAWTPGNTPVSFPH